MAQRKQLSWAELRVGVMVVVSLTIFAVLIFLMTGEGFFTRHYQLLIYMDNAGGLKKGDPVRLAGIDVGNVNNIRVSESHDPKRAVEVDLRLERRYQGEIRQDSVAILETEGLLGQRYIDVTRGSPGKPVVPSGAELYFRERPDLGDVMASTGTVLNSLNRLFDSANNIIGHVQQGEGTVGKLIYDESLYNRASATVDSMQKLVAYASSGQGSLGKFLANDDIYNQLSVTLGKADQVVDDVRNGKGSAGKFIYDPALYNQSQQLVARANNIVGDVEAGKGSLGKLMKDEDFYQHANSMVGKFDSIAGRMDRGEGSVGKLLHDQDFYTNMNTFSVELRELLADFRKNPKKFLTIHFRIF